MGRAVLWNIHILVKIGYIIINWVLQFKAKSVSFVFYVLLFWNICYFHARIRKLYKSSASNCKPVRVANKLQWLQNICIIWKYSNTKLPVTWKHCIILYCKITPEKENTYICSWPVEDKDRSMVWCKCCAVSLATTGLTRLFILTQSVQRVSVNKLNFSNNEQTFIHLCVFLIQCIYTVWFRYKTYFTIYSIQCINAFMFLCISLYFNVVFFWTHFCTSPSVFYARFVSPDSLSLTPLSKVIHWCQCQKHMYYMLKDYCRFTLFILLHPVHLWSLIFLTKYLLTQSWYIVMFIQEE